jgi:hypothetical protein
VVADPAKSEAGATFTFVNEGSQPVAILSVVTSCGCTAAKLEKKTYAPGEEGKLDVVIHYGSEVEQAEESVTITTDEKPDERHVLRLKLAVPGPRKRSERIEASPSSIEWLRGAKPVPQVVTLRVAQTNDAIRPTAASSADKDFQVTLRQPEPANEQLYELIVTPLRMDAPKQAVITITTNSRSFRPEWMPEITYQVVAAIK